MLTIGIFKKKTGTYYVWYKVVGDDNHNDTEPANITVTIAEAAVNNIPAGPGGLKFLQVLLKASKDKKNAGKKINVTVNGGEDIRYYTEKDVEDIKMFWLRNNGTCCIM